MDPLIIFFGLGVGILVGLTGMGGGSIMTPLLILVFGVKPVTAIGTDIAYGAVTKTLGGWRHLRQHTVDLGLSTWMAFGSVPAAVAGVFALRAIERATGADFDSVILAAVGITLLITGTAALARAFLLPSAVERERTKVPPTLANKLGAALIGLLVGFVLGFTSAGSGTLIGIALILIFRLVPTRVVGTDIFHAAVLLWAAAIAHMFVGDVDFALAGTILIGSLPGVWLGSRWAVRVPTGSLRLALGVLVVGGGLGLLAKAGVGIPTPVLAAVPLVLAAVFAGPALRNRARVRASARPASTATTSR